MAGWCGVSAWLCNLLGVMAMNYRRLLCSLRAGQHTMENMVQKPAVKFDMEAGEPLLEDEEEEEEGADGINPYVLSCFATTKAIQVMIGIASIIACGNIWWLIEYQSPDDLRGECGDQMYSIAFWLIWVLFTFVIWFMPVYCPCCCCLIGALVLRA